MSPTESANAALDYIRQRGGWTPTTAIFGHLQLPVAAHNPMRKILDRLEAAGVVMRIGNGKHKWRLKVTEWDRTNPFRVLGTTNITGEVPNPVVPQPIALVDDTHINSLIDARANDLIATAVASAVAKTKDELTKAGIVKTEITVRINDAKPVKLDSKPHASFDRCLRLATARRNILMIGPAGCGKTHLAEQVAKALKLEFAHISCSAGMSEGQITGRLIPGKGGSFEYSRSEFVKAYEEGGVFLFDEIDAADSNTLLVINSALANGKMTVPNRPKQPVAIKHKDFVAMAAANTFGTGADRQYVGRNQLDESTLDRFRIGQVEMDYDEELEAKLCPNESLRTRLQNYRRRAKGSVRRIISTRFLRDACLMVDAGDKIEEIEKALFAGWSVDEIRKVKGTV